MEKSITTENGSILGSGHMPVKLGQIITSKNKKTLFFLKYEKRMVFFMYSEASNELTLFSQELQRSLSPQALQQLVRKVGFVQRTSKYQAKDLIALYVWLNQ
jgi:transcription elongation factor